MPENALTLVQMLWWYWTCWDGQRAGQVATRLHRCWAKVTDPRIRTAPPQSTIGASFAAQRREAISFADEAITAGLRARVDSYLECSIRIPGYPEEIDFYTLVCFLREAAAIIPNRAVPEFEPPQAARICPGCKVVFEARRPNHHRCQKCSHKLAAPAYQGNDEPFRVPRLVPGTMVVQGFETARVKTCVTCGTQFLARDNKERHCERCRR